MPRRSYGHHVPTGGPTRTHRASIGRFGLDVVDPSVPAGSSAVVIGLDARKLGLGFVRATPNGPHPGPDIPRRLTLEGQRAHIAPQDGDVSRSSMVDLSVRNRVRGPLRPSVPSEIRRGGMDGAANGARSAADERQDPDPERHQAADRAHDREEQLAADPGRRRDATEQDREHGRDRRQADPLDERPRLARRSGLGRLPGLGPARRSSATLQVERHQVARDRCRDLAAAAGLLDEDRDDDLRVLGRGEADEPRVWLARAAQLGRPGLAGRRDARDLGARRELLAERRPRPPATIAALIASASGGDRTRPIDCRADRPRPAPLAASSTSPAAAASARRRWRRSTRRAPSGAASRTSRPGRTRRWPARRRRVNPPGCLPSPLVTCETAVGRSNGSGAPKPILSA